MLHYGRPHIIFIDYNGDINIYRTVAININVIVLVINVVRFLQAIERYTYASIYYYRNYSV